MKGTDGGPAQGGDDLIEKDAITFCLMFLTHFSLRGPLYRKLKSVPNASPSPELFAWGRSLKQGQSFDTGLARIGEVFGEKDHFSSRLMLFTPKLVVN